MRKGDLILIPFPFTDLTGSKYRPALVLVAGESDVTVAFVSSQLKLREPTDLLLKPSPTNGLKKESLLRLSKLATIDRSLVEGRLGDIDSKMIQRVNENLKKILRLENEY